MLTVFQKRPTVVVGAETTVIKIFDTEEQCEHDYRLVGAHSGLVLSVLKNGSKLRLVKVMSKTANVLIMERVTGTCLSDRSSLQIEGVTLVGRLLAHRHRHQAPNQLQLGDISVDHLYLSDDGETVTYIDPGNAFLVSGNSYEDLIRLLFSIAAASRFNPVHLSMLQTNVLRAYHQGSTGMEYSCMITTLEARYQQMRQKYHTSFNSLNLLISLVSLRYQFFITLRNLHRFHNKICS